MVKKVLRLEGLAFFLVAVYFYNLSYGNWWIFFLLLLVPDISMIGYLKNKEYGATIYNIGHNYIMPIILIALGVLTDITLLMHLGLILMAHVGVDRMLGFGLKYSESFKTTHMQKV